MSQLREVEHLKAENLQLQSEIRRLLADIHQLLLPEIHRLKTENHQLLSEIQPLQAVNQAAKNKEIAYRREQDDRARNRLDRLMLSNGFRREKLQTSKQISIPQEIIDQFIDHLYDDRGALKMCALVCRAWVPSSRHHLFGVVDIWVSMNYRFSTFIGHLDHPLCTFAPSVRKLFISTDTDDGHPTPRLLSPNWADPLIPYLPKLMSVTTLFTHEFDWDPLFQSAPFVTQITHLSLDSPGFMTFEDCMDTIHSFPSLESLEYFPNSRDDYSDQGTLPSLPAFQGSPPPSLRTLYIKSFCATTQLIWQWFHRSQTRLSVIKLGGPLSISTRGISPANLSTFIQYLQFLGPSLEVLQADFEAAPALSIFLDNVDLTLNTGLRVLELGLRLAFYVEAKSFDGELSSLPFLLSKSPKTTLTSIHLNISARNKIPSGTPMAEAGNAIEIWIAIDKLLSGPAFPALIKVVITIFNRIDGFEMSEYLECRMAQCKRKGLLCISNLDRRVSNRTIR